MSAFVYLLSTVHYVRVRSCVASQKEDSGDDSCMWEPLLARRARPDNFSCIILHFARQLFLTPVFRAASRFVSWLVRCDFCYLYFRHGLPVFCPRRFTASWRLTLLSVRLIGCSLRFGSVQCGSIRFRSAPFRSVPFGSVRFGSIRFGSVRFGSVRLTRLDSKYNRVG